MHLYLVHILSLCTSIVRATPISELDSITIREPRPIEAITSSTISNAEVNSQIKAYLEEIDTTALTDSADGDWDSILSNGKISSDGNWVAQHRRETIDEYEARVKAYRTQGNVTMGATFANIVIGHYKRDVAKRDPTCADAIIGLRQYFGIN